MLIALLDAETQCSVCVMAYVCGAASVCVFVVGAATVNKALVLKRDRSSVRSLFFCTDWVRFDVPFMALRETKRPESRMIQAEIGCGARI